MAGDPIYRGPRAGAVRWILGSVLGKADDPMTDMMTLALQQWAKLAQPRPRRYPRPGDLAKAVDVHTQTSAALQTIDDHLVGLMDPGSEHNALAIFMAPQEGKSERVSRRYAEWLLDHDPSLRIAIISYAEDLALRWGRTIKHDIAANPCQSGKGSECDERCGGLHIQIRYDSSAAGRWETPEGGGIYCVGVGGPLTGKPVDILIIDDPVKDRAAAESKTIRESTWDWWESVAIPRMGTNSRVVLIQTRWHEDDLAGRMLSRPSPLNWQVLRIPAIADESPDPLGRAIGDEMPSVRRRPPGHFRNLKANMSPYVFSGVYQQSPQAAEGNFFRRPSFRYWRPMEPWADGRERIYCEGQPVTLADCWKYITMDFAASTKNSADYTVCAVWAITPAGDLILLDLDRGRVPDHQHFVMAERLRMKWGVDQVYVESNWWSRTFVTDARDKGVPVAEVRADTDKVSRAIPAAGRVHSGRVWFPAEAAWLDDFTSELTMFPQATHDDQVDVLSYAVRVQIHEWTAIPNVTPGLTDWETQVNQAAAAATGHSDAGTNLFDVPY